MSVLFICQEAVPTGGLQTSRSIGFATELTRLGFNVELLTSKNRLLENSSLIQNTHRIQEISLLPNKNNVRFLAILNWLMFALIILKNLFRQSLVETVIYSSPSIPAAYTALLLARVKKARYVLDIRDFNAEAIEELGNYSSYSPMIIILKWAQRTIMKLADHIVYVQHNGRDYFKEHHINLNKTTFIPNGLNEDYINQQPQINPTQCSPNNQFSIAYSGNLGHAQDIPTLIEVFEKTKLIKDLEFRICGSGRFSTMLERQISVRELKHVKFYGQIYQHEANSMLMSSNVAILPLKSVRIFKYGVSPQKLYEYMYFQVPILFCMDQECIPNEYFNNGFRVDPGNADKIVSEILRIRQMNSLELIRDDRLSKEEILKSNSYKNLSKLYAQILRDE